jgi:hypothetical protein
MAIQRYGRYVTSPEPDFGEIGAGQQRACVYDPLSNTLIVYQLGGWLGDASGDPYGRIFVGNVSGGVPGSRIAYTSELHPTAIYNDNTGGASYTGDITPFIALATRQYSLGITARGSGALLRHSMRQAASIVAMNESFYNKYGLGSTVPTDPIGGSDSNEGHMSLWMTGMINEAPNIPTGLSPSGTVVSGTLTPNMVSNFSDNNEVLPNGALFDKLSQVQVQVRDPGAGTLRWDRTYSASTTEQANDQASIAYGGTALSYGGSYEWRTRHMDLCGAWSAWTSWTSFTIAPAGTVQTPTSPTGRITTVQPGPFVAKWVHQTSLSTNAVEIRRKIGDSIDATSPTITKTVANNGNISITWAEAAWSDLSWATPYTFEIRGRDTNGIWSPWSMGQSIKTNSAPAVPSNMLPANGSPVTSYPLLRAKCTDVDGDTITVKFRIKNNAGTVLYTRVGSYNAGSGYYEYQITSTDFATYTTYKWDTYSYDGYFYSGQTTTEANATKSAEQTIVYSQGPGTIILSPTDGSNIASRTVDITWTATGQVKRQIIVKDAAGNIIHDSTQQTTTSQFYTAGNLPIHNGDTITIQVLVTDSAPLTGIDTHAVTLVYAPAATIAGFSATPVLLNLDPDPTGVYLQWNTTTYAGSVFQNYELYRTPLDSVGGSPTGGAELLRRITNSLQTAFLDCEAKSGVAYRYDLYQTIFIGLDILSSVAASAQVMLDFGGVVIHNVYNPEQYHIYFKYSADADKETNWKLAQDVSYELPTGATKSRAIRGSRNEWNPSGNYLLLTDSAATREQRRDLVVSILEHGGTLCIREGQRQKRYVSVKSAEIIDGPFTSTVNITWQEVNFISGEQS